MFNVQQLQFSEHHAVLAAGIQMQTKQQRVATQRTLRQSSDFHAGCHPEHPVRLDGSARPTAQESAGGGQAGAYKLASRRTAPLPIAVFHMLLAANGCLSRSLQGAVAAAATVRAATTITTATSMGCECMVRIEPVSGFEPP